MKVRNIFKLLDNYFKEQKKKTENPAWDYAWMMILFTVVLGIWLIYLAFAGNMSFSGWEEAGKFGDAFGAINALFSGLAFAALIVAVILQRLELVEQRKELTLARIQFEKSTEAQEKSEAALSKQAIALERTAKINGINALLGYYIPMVEKSQRELNEPGAKDSNRYERFADEFAMLVDKREDLLEELEVLIKSID